jgi:hypothetical protein
MRQALDRRRRYISLYRAVHAQQAGYLPGNKGQAAAKIAGQYGRIELMAMFDKAAQHSIVEPYHLFALRVEP